MPSTILPFSTSPNNWGFIDGDGVWAIQPSFTSACHFSEDLALVKKNGLFGFINRNGESELDFQFIDSLGFWQGVASIAVSDEDSHVKWGLIDRKGNYIITPKYEFVGPLFEGLARFNQNGKWGYLDRLGNVIISPIYDWAGEYIDGIARVQKVGADLETFYINRQGTPINSEVFEQGEDFSDGKAAVSRNGKWGFINQKGELEIPFIYSEVGAYSENRIPVTSDGKAWYFINAIGMRCDKQEYQYACPFQDGLARVVNENKWGFIDRHGVFFIKPEYDYIEDYVNGWAYFSNAGNIGYINKSNKKVLFTINKL